MTARRLKLGALWLGALVCVSCLCCSSALATTSRGHVFGGTFGEPCSAEPCGNGQFKEPAGVAVDDSSGDVYVVDKGDNRVERFSSTGVYLGQFNGSGSFEVEGKAETGTEAGGGGLSGETPTGQFAGPEAIAVDNSRNPTDPSAGDVYVLDIGHGVVDKFSPTGAYVAQISRSQINAGINGISIDNEGKLFVLLENSETDWTGLDYFDNSAPQNSLFYEQYRWRFGFTRQGFAVDSAGNFYVSNFFQTTTEIDPYGHPIREYAHTSEDGFAVDESGVYVDSGSTVEVFSSSSGALTESLGKGHLISGSGVGLNSSSETVYVADAGADVVDVFPPDPPSEATVESDGVSDVTGNSATLVGEIDPRGAGTEYHFEYGSCVTVSACVTSAYEESAPAIAGKLDSSFEIDTVSSLHVQGLLPHSVYHARLVAHNEFGTTYGEEVVFTTQTSGSELALPDGREWEMVSPVEKQGALLFPITQEGVIQASVDGNAIAYIASQPTELGANANTAPTLVQEMSRRGVNGWETRTIATPHSGSIGVTAGQGLEYRAFSSDLSLALVEPQGPFTSLSSEDSERTEYVRHDATCEASPATCYQPLVTSAPGHEDVPPGTKFGGPTAVRGDVNFLGATPDLSHVILTSSVGLTSTPGDNGGLYEWSEGKLQIVSVLPASEGGAPAGGALSLGGNNPKDAVSEDGSRVFWSSGGVLYMRDMPLGKSLRIGGEFEDANMDGSRVFFSGEECEVKLDEATGELECPVIGTDGSLVGISKDGSWVYFVSGASLYVNHDGTKTFIANLSGEDAPDWGVGDNSGLRGRTAEVTPDGEWLAFMSAASLTGYDNRDAVSGQRDEEVFLYNAVSRRLVCASCNPTGARPSGVAYGDAGYGSLYAGTSVWRPENWIAANIPGGTSFDGGEAIYQSRYLNSSGRLFFNSSDALVPQDVNGTEDVYEYEPPGVGNCTTGSVTYSEVSDGCVDLVSAGTSAEESGFMDASEEGRDVFFLTTSKLVSQDVGGERDLYDARECSAVSPCATTAALAPPPCDTGDACKPAPLPQPTIYGAPSSETFSGAGNVAPVTLGKVSAKSLTATQRLSTALKRCRKKTNRKRVACEKTARARFAKTQSRRVNTKKKGQG